MRFYLKKAEGYFKETDNDSIIEKVSKDNRIIGFNIINVSKITSKKPIELELKEMNFANVFLYFFIKKKVQKRNAGFYTCILSTLMICKIFFIQAPV